MNIKEIYHKYRILPTLQTHLFRVAAVGKLIALNSLELVEVNNIVITCLLHDMGNIIKFSFDYRPESYEPEGVNHWKEIKQEFIAKYGNDEHEATLIIAKEIGVSSRIIDLLKNVGFSCGKQIFESNDLTKIICAYSDHRVAPYGVLSLKERVKEGMDRFIKNKPEYDTPENNKLRDELLGYFIRMEEYIFSRSKIKPQDIHDKSIEALMNDLVVQKDFVL